MKNILLVSVFSVLTSLAQEKQNDASWEETVNYIRDNKACIKELFLGGYNLEAPPIKDIQIDSLNIIISYDHTFETLKYDYVWKMRDVGRLSLPLLHLQEVYGEDEIIFIKLIDESATHDNKQYLWSPSGNGYLYDPNSGTKKTDFLAFSVLGLEASSQFQKVLKHLSYLAREKRKTIR